MHTNEATTGGIQTTDDAKRRLAKQSIRFNLENPQFEKIFRPHYDKLGISKGDQLLDPSQPEFKAAETMNGAIDEEK